ncbi:MAG: ABC transporter permease [Deltaproteobacteria bacterium]|nr:ABC transporter permease [Deltaproteobacteria bacterium]
MSHYFFKRLALIIPTFLGITLLTFFMIKLAPGSPIEEKLQSAEGMKAQNFSQEVIDQIQVLYGLKVVLPGWYEHFIHSTNARFFGVSDVETQNWFRRSMVWVGENCIQYGRWMKSIVHLDFGISFKDNRKVIDKIKEALPITLALNLIEVLIVYFISLPLGVYSAFKKDSFFDKSLMLTLFTLYSLPTFWVAMILIMLFSSGEYFNWFPMFGLWSDGAEHLSRLGYLENILWHLVLPIVCMVYGSFAFLSRFSRANMLEVIQQDYIRTARAKGLTEKQVVWKHAFRNSLIPLVTLMGTLLPALLGGSVIIEQIFSIPGMGRLGFEAVFQRDYPLIMAIAAIEALLTLISLLLSDLLYVAVDPRIDFSKS